MVDADIDFTIPNCPLRHNNMPFYTPMSQLPDTRIHIMIRGAKGSGKSILIQMFLAEGTGFLHSVNQDMGEGMKTMLGANSITEAGMFGSVDEEGNVLGRPIAREMCGGFLGFEENPEKEREYKQAQHIQSNVSVEERTDLARLSLQIKQWLRERMEYAVAHPPSGVMFGDDILEWLEKPAVRSFEADLFRRICIGYHMMRTTYVGGQPLVITLDDTLREILNQSLEMRRTVMDADLELIRSTFWMKDLPKSEVVKEVSRMVTNGDYQSAKRWIQENLEGQSWYAEFEPESKRRGRKGMLCRFGKNAAEDLG